MSINKLLGKHVIKPTQDWSEVPPNHIACMPKNDTEMWVFHNGIEFSMSDKETEEYFYKHADGHEPNCGPSVVGHARWTGAAWLGLTVQDTLNAM